MRTVRFVGYIVHHIGYISSYLGTTHHDLQCAHKLNTQSTKETERGKRERSQTIHGCSGRSGDGRSTGGDGVGVVRRRHRFSGDVLGGSAEVGVVLPASVVLPVAGSAPLFDRVRVRMSVG
jgi:hypothetical protein